MPRRKTHAEHVAEIAAKNPNVEIIGQITGATDKVLTRCLICGYEWMALPSTLKQGHGCPKCSGRVVTHDEHMAAIIKANPNVEVLEKITNVNKKVLCRCKICRHEWSPTPDSLKHGYGCPECAKIKRANAKRKTHDKHVADIKKVNPNIEILEEIKSATQKVLCRCLVCDHKWRPTPDKLKKGRGCPKCAGQGKTQEEHQADVTAANPNIKILGKVERVDKPVLCLCLACGHKWNARISNIKNGKGCPGCARRIKGMKKRLTTKEFIEKAEKKYGGFYNYSRVNYTTAKKDVIIICPIHGEFEQWPSNHLNGEGCPKCAKRGFLGNDFGKLYIMVDDLNVPTMMKIGVSVQEDERSKQVLRSAKKAGVTIPALHVAKTWEGPTDLMIRIEQMMHENYEEWNIKFPAKFDGCTEFFRYTPETAEAFDVIEETIHEIINGNKAA